MQPTDAHKGASANGTPHALSGGLMRAWLQHHLNAQHVCCRLLALRIPPKMARAVSRWWERKTKRILYPRREERR